MSQTVYDAAHTYYAKPAISSVPYDGGFIVDPIDIAEVLDELGFDGHPDFLQAIFDAEVNGDGFVPIVDGHWTGSHPHEVLSLPIPPDPATCSGDIRPLIPEYPATWARPRWVMFLMSAFESLVKHGGGRPGSQ